MSGLDGYAGERAVFACTFVIAILSTAPGHAAPTIYDYGNRTQGTDIFAYDGESSSQVPTSSTAPSSVLSSTEYDDIEFDDDAFHTNSLSSNNKYPQMRFVIQIDENESIVTRLDPTWNGKGVNENGEKTDGASLYIWNYASSSYQLVQASPDTEGEVTLTGSVASNPADYIGGAGQDTVVLFVVSNDKSGGVPNDNELFTDYVKLEVSFKYFLIEHDGAGTNCVAELITVTAKDSDGSTLTDYTGTIILDTQTGTGTWFNGPGNNGTFLDPMPNDGLATYTFAAADNGSASFLFDYQTGPSAFDIDVYDSGNPAFRDDDTEGNITFSPSGFVVTANPLSNPPPNPIYDPIQTQAAGTTFSLHLTVYGQTETNPTCGVIESYTASQMLKFWFTYSDPSSGAVQVTINGSSIATSEGSSVAQAVTFTNGQASVTAKYKDVGRIQISMKDETVSEPPGGLRGASNPFVVRPADFLISSVTRTNDSSNPGAWTPSGEVFVAAGAPFYVTVQVGDSEGSLTPNYGNEAVAEGIRLVASTLVAPAGGRNGTNDDGAIGNASAFSAISPAGTFKGTTFYWDEVGAIRLQASVADGDYLGAGDVTGTESGTVGQFNPDHFDVAYNTPEFGTACGAGGFTYMGQEFGYTLGCKPVITVTARNAQGTTTQNYTGSWFKITTSSLTGLAYASESGTLSAPGPNPPSISDLGAGASTLTFDNGPQLSFVRSTPVAPFNAEISLSANVIDEDGVAYSGNPAKFGDASAGNGIDFSSGKTIRFGRVAFENAHGSELLTLPVPLRAEYYDGMSFATHASDSCTQLTTSDLALTPNPGGLSSTPTIANSPLVSGDAGLTLSALGAGNTGYFDLAFDLSTATGADLPWLRGDWDGDGSYDDDPTGRATFGVFKGNKAIIYIREIY